MKNKIFQSSAKVCGTQTGSLSLMKNKALESILFKVHPLYRPLENKGFRNFLFKGGLISLSYLSMVGCGSSVSLRKYERCPSYSKGYSDSESNPINSSFAVYHDKSSYGILYIAERGSNKK